MRVAALLALHVVGCAGALVALTPERAPRAPRRPSAAHRWPPLVGVGSAIVVLLVSGWLLPAALVGVAAWLAVRGRVTGRRSAQREVDTVEAIASWIERLRDVLLAGDQPIGAIAATVPTCPPPIRGPVRRLAAGLGHQDPDIVFRRFADDLDDPIGDLVATGLLIAVRRGARTAAVLTALADQARQQADRRRIVDAERAPVRREVTSLSLIMGLLLVGLLVAGRSQHLDAYDSFGGQLFLTVALVAYGGLLLRVQRLARYPRPARFLSLAGGAR